MTMRLAGVELYFDDLDLARRFYQETLGLALTEAAPGHFAKFDAGGFVCLECKGKESYPSKDKAVLFFEVSDLPTTVAHLGSIIVKYEPTDRGGWAVAHDPEGHNILLLPAIVGGDLASRDL